MYTPVVDKASHAHGPESDEARAALGEADEFVASLRALVAARNATHLVDLVVVSDHGMTTTSSEKLIYLDEVLGAERLASVLAIDGWPSAGLHFRGDSDAERARNLARAEARLRAASGSGEAQRYSVYRREELPGRWHWRGSERVAPLWVVPRLPWSITSREEMQAFKSGGYEPIG